MAALMLVTACAWAAGLNGKITMANTLLTTLEAIADRLTDRDVSVNTLTEMLGEVDRQYSGSGYYLRPRNNGLDSVWLGIVTVRGVEEPASVEVAFAPQGRLTTLDLDRTFGAHKIVPVNPDGRQRRVRYLFDRSGKAYTAAIYATLAGPPDDTRVESVSMRRDAR